MFWGRAFHNLGALTLKALALIVTRLPENPFVLLMFSIYMFTIKITDSLQNILAFSYNIFAIAL